METNSCVKYNFGYTERQKYCLKRSCGGQSTFSPVGKRSNRSACDAYRSNVDHFADGRDAIEI